MSDDVLDLLKESEQRFRTMADTAPVLLWMAGTDGLCNFFNQGWLDFTGRTMAEEMGNGWAEGVHAEDFQRCMHTYLSAFVERRPFRMEYRLRRRDGEHRWLLDTGVPRYTPGGQFAGYIGSCIDVTEFKLARETLELRVRERTGELEQANRELEAFTYAVAHDLRAPLRAVGGFAEVLLADHHAQLDADGQDCLREIRGGVVRMAELIDALLSLSRVSRMDLASARVDLGVIARDVFSALAAAQPRERCEIAIHDGLEAEMDPSLARAVLENLLGNAWKFTSKTSSPRIELGVARSSGGRTFFVRDNGAGFDPSHARKLFAPFQRLHTTSEFPGTGVGLATVQRIVQRHGGRIWAEGEPGLGATFYFTVGAAEASTPHL